MVAFDSVLFGKDQIEIKSIIGERKKKVIISKLIWKAVETSKQRQIVYKQVIDWTIFSLLIKNAHNLIMLSKNVRSKYTCTYIISK